MESSSNPAEIIPPWLDLPREITATILHKLGAIEILSTAETVCTVWRSICLDASMWRSIDMRNEGYYWDMPYDLVKMCRRAVDRSQGQLIDINVEHFCTDDLLLYITRSSRRLKRLQLALCTQVTGQALVEAVTNVPFLEELHIYYTPISAEAIESAGRSCPRLKSFKMSNHLYRHCSISSDLEAFAVGKYMPSLQHLQLFANQMTNEGLKAILNGCPRLESLDLRQCFNVHLGGHLGIPIPLWIKDFRCPHDSTDDYCFPGELLQDYEASDDEYITGFSDVDMVSDNYEYMEFSDASVSSYGDEYELFPDL